MARNAALARACLQGCGRPGARLLCAVDHALGRVLLAALETLYLPGIGAHYAWRKRRIRRWALQACGDGARQLLVLGAGFDGLSLFLLERIPGLRAFEIERESTVAIKREALCWLGVREPRLSLIAADLSVVAIEALLPGIPRFDPRQPTLVVAEGVLMYLEPPELQRLLRGLARTLPGAGLIATAMAPAAAGAPVLRASVRGYGVGSSAPANRSAGRRRATHWPRRWPPPRCAWSASPTPTRPPIPILARANGCSPASSRGRRGNATAAVTRRLKQNTARAAFCRSVRGPARRAPALLYAARDATGSRRLPSRCTRSDVTTCTPRLHGRNAATAPRRPCANAAAATLAACRLGSDLDPDRSGSSRIRPPGKRRTEPPPCSLAPSFYSPSRPWAAWSWLRYVSPASAIRRRGWRCCTDCSPLPA
nr:class I SAM-dependent methyltransferase [Lysobacter enzymogenes]